jgi:tripartite-type tricarboxylate transporter receptor subunit TctC
MSNEDRQQARCRMEYNQGDEMMSGKSATSEGTRGRRGALRKLAAAAAIACCGVGAHAQQKYPAKPIRIVVGSSAGGLADVIARLAAQKVGESTGGTVIVENKAGAAGNIATDFVAKSAPDGYTMLLAPDAMLVVNPFVYNKLPFDTARDLQPVALLGKAILVLVASPSLGVRNTAEFHALVKAKPNTITFGTGGAGHPTHIAMEMYRNRLGLNMVHVPYKGSAPAMQGLLGGEVTSMIVGVAEAMPHIKSGRIVALAASGPNAKEMFPNLPEFRDFHPDLDLTAWFGVFVPTGTPKEVISVLHSEFNKMLQHPDVRKRLDDFGLVPMPRPPGELDGIMKVDRARYGPLVKSLGLTAD